MARIAVPLLIGVAGIAILMSLGIWQVQRLDWKNGVLAAIDERIQAEPGPVPAMPNATSDLYAPVVVNGQTSGPELHVLVSHKKLGAGYRLITRFDEVTGRSFLLDLGFVDLELKDMARPMLTGTVEGNLNWPDDRNSSTPANDTAANIWFARDIADMSDALGTEPVLIVLREAEGLSDTIVPLPVDSSSIPNDHLEYAITWFSLAFIWFGMTAYLVWRITRLDEKGKS